MAVFCATALVFGGCSENGDGTTPGTEITDPDNEYTFVRNITGYWGNSKTGVNSAFLKLYKKGSTYYVKAGNGETYAACSRNNEYSASYTGRDPHKKYKYCAKLYTITYYFDI